MPSSGDSDCAVVVIRPPNECPPARSVRSGAALCAAITAFLIVSTQVAFEFLALPCSEYGKLYRNVAIPTSASRSAIVCIVACRIVVLAPCPSTSKYVLISGRIKMAETSPLSLVALTFNSSVKILTLVLRHEIAIRHVGQFGHLASDGFG